ncbi:unnamed protein product [Paramecium sonneborni]|uniref:Kinesin motor domain-containing protein n=1 Tax=Paramecium sonneborni TaxID=65129 RepID=A0A8S1Q5U9_9CILI|nr:unnamed protein product [Paramecium sonneborni]
MYEKVKVAVRLRPLIEQELLAKDKAICVDSIDNQKKSIIIKKDFEKRQFNFDTIFDPKVTQSQIYNEIARNIVTSAIKGFNGTIFCYGQTGTGKTYTMMGKIDTEEKGIIPRTFEQIFNEIALDDDYSYSVQIGYLHIYMEMLLDLIRPDNSEVKIRESLDHGVFVSGLKWLTVESPSECLKIINQAEKNKVIAFTNLNAHSSRSHSILIIKLDKKLQRQHSKSVTTFNKNYTSKSNLSQDFILGQLNQNINCSVGTLYLVDLAGSERIKKSKVSGDRLNEARSINCSLTALGKCIHALTCTKYTFIPFRDSKLTRILQEALGGNCKTALIINIGPAVKHVEETLSSLTFGMRAMKITNTPQINQTVGLEELVQQLKQELEVKKNIIQKLEIQQKQTKNQDNYKSNSDIHYKIKLEKVEEQHKGFLEEVDKVMVEQEQENEQLKKQLAKTIIEYEDSKNREELLQQQILILTQKLHEFDNQIQTLQNYNIHLRNQIQQQQDLKQNKNVRDQQQQEITFRNSSLIQMSKEKQNQQWRSELSQITSQYANKLEEVKRFEMYHSGKENQNLQEEKLKNENLTSQIKQLKIEYQEKQLKLNQIINQLDQQIQKLNEQREFENRQFSQKIHKLENEIIEISILFEQSQRKSKQLNDQLEQNDRFYKQQQQVSIDLQHQLEEQNYDLKKQIHIIQEQFENHKKNSQQLLEQQVNEINILKQQKDDYYQQFQQIVLQQKDLQLLQFNSNKSIMQSLNTHQSIEQNIDIELKNSINLLGLNEGQIVIDLQMRILQLENEIKNLQNKIKQKDLNEENGCYEIVKNLLDQIVIQIEQNLSMPFLQNNCLSNKKSENQLNFGQGSLKQLEINQLVESLFIDSRHSAEHILTECEEYIDLEIKNQVKNINQDGNNQEQLDFCNQIQESAFSFGQDQNRVNSLFQQNKQICNNDKEKDEINVEIDICDSLKQSLNELNREINFRKQNQDKNNDQIDRQFQQCQKQEEKNFDNKNKIEEEELQQVIKLMQQILKDQNKKKCEYNGNSLDVLKSSIVDFNNLCNTLTSYFQ